MAWVNAVDAKQTGVQTINAGVWTGSALTQHSLLVGGASSAITSLGSATNGQIPIGSTGNDPVLATITAGTGISISNGAGTITVNSIGGGLTWNDVTGTSANMLANNGYLANNAGLVTLTLPSLVGQFEVICVQGFGAGGWQIAQNASQRIIVGDQVTSTGVGGSLASTNANDCVQLIVANVGATVTFSVQSSVGNLTLV